jgi:hypothetical protein
VVGSDGGVLPFPDGIVSGAAMAGRTVPDPIVSKQMTAINAAVTTGRMVFVQPTGRGDILRRYRRG